MQSLRTRTSARRERAAALPACPSAPRRHRCPAPGSRRPTVDVRAASGVRARWCIDAEYGHKQTVQLLLQEWVADVGSKAGLTLANTRLNSGSVGVAESRLELEVTFASLAQWEDFLSAIPAKEHAAWSQRMQGMVVGGSPRWELFRAVPAFPAGQGQAAAGARVGEQAGAAAPAPVWTWPALSSSSAQAVEPAPQAYGSISAAPGGSGLSIIDNPEDAEVVLDWKGDPLKLNPNDKLPFKFL